MATPKKWQEHIDTIQEGIRKLNLEIKHADEFTAVEELLKCMNATELALHKVRQTFERRLDDDGG